MFPVILGTRDTGPSITVTPALADNILALGDLPDSMQTGGFNITFAPSDDFVGSFLIMGHNCVRDTADAGIVYQPYPFRAFYLNGAPSDLSMQIGGTLITDRSDVLIPASGARLAIYVNCSQGSCYIGQQAVVGSTAP